MTKKVRNNFKVTLTLYSNGAITGTAISPWQMLGFREIIAVTSTRVLVARFSLSPKRLIWGVSHPSRLYILEYANAESRELSRQDCLVR